MKSTLDKGQAGESLIFKKLKDNNFDVSWVSIGEHGDFRLSNGILIDVKFSSKYFTSSGTPIWRFNIHHHGKKQDKINIFICIAQTTKNESIIFVFPSDLFNSKTITISKKQIDRGKYDHFVENWDIIRHFNQTG